MEKDTNDNIINLSFLNYINDNYNENKNLLILVNEGGEYFMVVYYNNTNIDLNYNSDNKISNQNNNKEGSKTFNNQINIKNYKKMNL